MGSIQGPGLGGGVSVPGPGAHTTGSRPLAGTCELHGLLLRRDQAQHSTAADAFSPPAAAPPERGTECHREQDHMEHLLPACRPLAALGGCSGPFCSAETDRAKEWGAKLQELDVAEQRPCSLLSLGLALPAAGPDESCRCPSLRTQLCQTHPRRGWLLQAAEDMWEHQQYGTSPTAGRRPLLPQGSLGVQP